MSLPLPSTDTVLRQKETALLLDDMAALGFQTIELEDIREEHLLVISAQKDVIRDNLRFNQDTANPFMLRENLAPAVLRLKGSLDYVHISGNGGQRVGHLPPGESAIAWDPFFQTLRQTGFDGLMGVDLGGAETPLNDPDAASIDAARWIQKYWTDNRHGRAEN